MSRLCIENGHLPIAAGQRFHDFLQYLAAFMGDLLIDGGTLRKCGYQVGIVHPYSHCMVVRAYHSDDAGLQSSLCPEIVDVDAVFLHYMTGIAHFIHIDFSHIFSLDQVIDAPLAAIRYNGISPVFADVRYVALLQGHLRGLFPNQFVHADGICRYGFPGICLPDGKCQEGRRTNGLA